METKKKNAKSLPKKAWSLLAYIAGDNNLSDNGLEDIQEMCEVGASPQMHVAVEIDTAGEHNGSIRYEISEPDATGAAHRIVIERLGEQNSGSPKTLRRTLQWGLQRYPATNRLVVVWNHGAGFRTVRRDIAFDDSSLGASMDMNEIELAFRQAGVSPQNRIQVLGFDACLMNMIEVVHHLRGLVDVVVGSEQVEPGDGWPYDRVLEAIKAAKSPSDLGRRIVKAYIAANAEIGESNVTQSAIAVDATEAAVKAMGELGRLLADRMGAMRNVVANVRVRTQSYEYADYVDLVDLATRIRAGTTDTAVRVAAQAVITTTRAAVILSQSIGGSVAGSNGLSVWFPSDLTTYLGFRSKYAALHCSERHPGWMQFLDAFHSRSATGDAGIRDRGADEAD